MALSRPCSQNDDLEEDAVPDLPTVKRSTSLNKGIQDTRYPKEYDFVLFYLFEDGDGAQLFYDELIGYGLKGCFYDDKSILPSSILLNHSIEVHEYACECSTYYILYVSQNLCKAMKLFSVHEDRVFKHAKYAALCKSLKTYKNHFVPFYPTLKREMKDIPFALGPLAGLEAKSRFYKKHLCALFGLVTVDNYITLQVDENHAAQQKKEDRRKKHAEEEKMKQSLPDSFEDDFRLSLGIGKAEEKHGEQPSNQANPSEDVNACSLPSGKPQTSPDGSLAPILAANEKPVYPKLEDLDQMVTNQTTLDANDGRQREEGNLTVVGARNTAAPTDLSGGKKEQSTERPVSSGGVEESLSPSIECRNNDAEGGNQAPQTSSNDHANGESTTSLTLSSDGGVNVGNSAPPPPGDDCVVVDGPVQAPVGNDGCERKDSSSNTPVVGHDQHVKASIDGESAPPTMPGADGIEVDRPVQAPVGNDGGERKDSSSVAPVVGHDIGGGDQHVKASCDVGHDQVSTKTGEDLYHQKVEKQVRQPPDGASLSDQIDPPIKWNISQVKKLAPGGSDYQVGYVEAFMGPRHGSFQFGLPKLLGDPPLPRASSKQPQPAITAPHSSEVPRSNGGQHRPEQASDGAGNTTNTSQMQTNVFNISNTIIHHTQLIHQPASQPQAQPQINITMQPDSNLNMQVGDSNTIDQSTNEGTEEEVEYVRE